MESFTVITWAGQNSTFESPSPQCATLHPTSSEKMKVQLQCHSFAEMRLEALKAHGSEALPRSRIPGNCCYATVEIPNQSAACCSLRLNCTTMFQILVSSAVYTPASIEERHNKEEKCMLMLLPCPLSVVKKMHDINNIDHYTICGVVYLNLV